MKTDETANKAEMTEDDGTYAWTMAEATAMTCADVAPAAVLLLGSGPTLGMRERVAVSGDDQSDAACFMRAVGVLWYAAQGEGKDPEGYAFAVRGFLRLLPGYLSEAIKREVSRE